MVIVIAMVIVIIIVIIITIIANPVPMGNSKVFSECFFNLS